jgi:hypothetical protein
MTEYDSTRVPVIPVHRKLRKEDHEFEAILASEPKHFLKKMCETEREKERVFINLWFYEEW